MERSGIKVEKYFASEVDKYAIKVTQANYPNTIQLGDVRNVNGENLPKIDLLIGGSPCTGFSSAGKRLNFDDPRSALFFEYARILKECQPKYFLLENVKMKKECQNIISNELGVQPIRINSNLVSAQNRDRLYWTNIPNVEQPKDKEIYWGDVRENNVNCDKYYYTEKAIKWLVKHSKRKNKALTVHQNDDKMQMVEASHFKKYSSQRFFGIPDFPNKKESIAAIRGRYVNNTNDIKQYIEFRHDDKTNSLTTVTKDNVVVPFTLPNKIPADEFFFRYITPLECERLQTLPDNYTNHASDTQRYKMLGNCWTVDVVKHIFDSIPREES